MAILRWERFAVILAASLFLSATFTTDLFAAPGVTLGTTFVPKEKMLLFICIGNSEMTGRETKADFSTVPNAWSYRIPNPPVLLDRKQGNADIASTLYKWALAKTPLHIDRNDNFNKQDPTTPFIQSLAKRPENASYYFGVMQLSGSEYLMSTFQRGKYRYDTIMNNVIKMKDNVTIAAVVSMFNSVEVQSPYPATEITPYLANTQKTVSQIREDLGMPNLPYIHSGYPVNAKGVYDPTLADPKRIIPIIQQIPGAIANSTLIPTDGLSIYMGDSYKSHYDSLGCHNWGSRVADTVMAHHWGFSTNTSREVAAVKKVRTERATDAVYITNGRIPAALSMGAAIYTLQGKCVGGLTQNRRQARAYLNPGVYIVKKDLR
jgi:hypothetical protein